MEGKGKQSYYGTMDGLRAISALGIVMMHILVNGGYELEGFVFQRLIPSFTELVYLFMMLSSFGMCCGYYEKVLENKISVGEFYSKRFAKIWPFFAFLSILDVALSPEKSACYELFANLTLCFGLLPNANSTVIGVGWFIGAVFVFYLVFPFFCYLLSDKLRAWFAFGISFLYNVLCQVYFFDKTHVAKSFVPRTNFLYCAVFFLAGGLIYLYRDKIIAFAKKGQWLLAVLLVGAILGYYSLGSSVLKLLVTFSLILMCTLGMKHQKLLENELTHFLSGISMEIYLCHMVIFRVAEKLHLVHIAASQTVSYIVALIVTLLGAICFSVLFRVVLKKLQEIMGQKISSNKERNQLSV